MCCQAAARSPIRCPPGSLFPTTLSTLDWRYGPPACSASSTLRGYSPPPMCTSPAGWPNSRMSLTRPFSWRSPSRCAGFAAGRCASTFRRCARSIRRCPGRSRKPGCLRCGRVRWSGRGSRSAASSDCSTWTGIGGRRSRSDAICWRDRPSRLPRSTAGCWPRVWRGCSPTPTPSNSGWPPRSPPPNGRRCSAAGRAPGRPPPSRGCWHCCWHNRARRCGLPWPRRPERPRPGCSRPCRTRRAPSPTSTVTTCPRWRRRRCTGCWAGCPVAATVSGTIATTGCRSMWWSSTKPRWCR